MKILLAILSLVVTLALPAYAKDMQEYLNDTQTMVKEGNYKGALDRYIWFHDHALEHNPAMYGVRLSFALSYWKQLGELYPPALSAIEKTRDAKTALIAQGNGDRNLFHDVVALNRTLGDDSKTVVLFRKLDQDQNDVAHQYWNLAKDTIIKAKAYDLAKKYIGNPVHEFDEVRERYDRTKAMYGRKNFGENFKIFNEKHFVDETLNLINVAVAIDDVIAAKEIQRKALAILDDKRLRSIVIKEH